jgi:hypothetical protein
LAGVIDVPDGRRTPRISCKKTLVTVNPLRELSQENSDSLTSLSPNRYFSRRQAFAKWAKWGIALFAWLQTSVVSLDRNLLRNASIKRPSFAKFG